MTIELLSPVSTRKGEIVDLARKRYRKQLLPLTEITYKGKKKRFDLAYMNKVKRAFEAGAFSYIPVKLAAGDSAHTDDVLRTGGRLVDLIVSEKDGLVGELELNDDGLKAVNDSDGHVPVSVKILENLVRDDGDHAQFDAALAHVLITDDPYVRGMSPWKEATPVALSENRVSVTETIDLSAEHFGDPEENMTDTKATVTLQLTAAQRDRLVELANQEDELKELGLKPEDFEEGDPTQAELTDPRAGKRTVPEADPKGKPDVADLGSDEDGEDEVDEEDGVQLSRQATRALELARADAAAARAETMELARTLQKAGIDREIGELERKGLAPAILKLARPALEQPQVIELSRGGKIEKTDSAQIMRDVLNEVIELARTGHDVIDLDRLSGVLMDDEETTQSTREAQLASLRETYGN